MGKSRVKVDLLGTSFQIQADEDAAYLAEIVAYLSGKVSEVRREVPVADPVKVALLVGLNLTDELFKARAGREIPDDPEIGQIATRIIERIDRTLDD